MIREFSEQTTPTPLSFRDTEWGTNSHQEDHVLDQTPKEPMLKGVDPMRLVRVYADDVLFTATFCLPFSSRYLMNIYLT
jgi:hypothetical protein